MYGVSGEVAYHFPLGTILHSEWEAVPFYRYTYENLQTGGFAGTDLNTPTGAGQMQFHNVGVAVFPSPKIVLKATYQKVINNASGGAQVGFRFSAASDFSSDGPTDHMRRAHQRARRHRAR